MSNHEAPSKTRQTVPRVFLGLFFCVSATLKLLSLTEFELYVFSFGLASFDLCSVAARLLVAGEAVLGLGLLSGWWKRFVNISTAVLLLSFSAFLLWRTAVGDEQSCHCFGAFADMGPSDSLWKNVACAVLLYLGRQGGEIRLEARFRPWVAAGLCVAVLATVVAVNPPDFFYRLTKPDSSDLNVAECQKLGLSAEGKKVVCFYSVDCEHCRHCVSKMAGIIRHNSLPEEDFLCVFMGKGEDDDAAVSKFFKTYGGGIALPYQILDPLTFIQLTNGSMPLVCLFDNGSLLKEYDLLKLNEQEITSFQERD